MTSFPKKTQVTWLGSIWASLSVLSALMNSTGFYMPYWIQGTLLNQKVYFGSFRRCNYPKLNKDHLYEITAECGRYTTFGDIPSFYWQISTILVGVGAAVSLMVAFTSLSGCCMSGVISKGSARILGAIQMFAGLLMLCGGGIYPYGFYAPEVRDACGGRSGFYRLGSCQVSWSFYAMSVGTIGLFIASLISFCVTKKQKFHHRILHAAPVNGSSSQSSSSQKELKESLKSPAENL